MTIKNKKIGFSTHLSFIVLGLLFLSSCMNLGLKRLNKYNGDNTKTGYWITVDSLGWIEFQNYSNGKLHGQFKRFRDNGNIAISGRYKNGTKVKTWRFYNSRGQVISWTKYRKGRVIKEKIGSISF